MCLQFTRVHVFLFRPKKITLVSGNAGDEKTFARAAANYFSN